MREELLALLKKDAYRKGEFTLSSGAFSTHYVNCKPVTLNGKGLFYASCLLLECIEEDTYAVAGLTLGADPLVSGVVTVSAADEVDLDGLIIRKEPKGHGTQSQIEGPVLPKGAKVTVLEDVTTTGQSALKAVYVLRDAGYVVDRVITIVDRQDYDCRSIMEQEGLDFISLFTIDDLAK
tara:strand:+ start:1054 stop:1590 length:537 start_codon:yes stop_codon:yes gene_type:complete